AVSNCCSNIYETTSRHEFENQKQIRLSADGQNPIETFVASGRVISHVVGVIRVPCGAEPLIESCGVTGSCAVVVVIADGQKIGNSRIVQTTNRCVCTLFL